MNFKVFLLWQNTYNRKLTILAIFKCKSQKYEIKL